LLQVEEDENETLMEEDKIEDKPEALMDEQPDDKPEALTVKQILEEI
jgi:hypothetical protein